MADDARHAPSNVGFESSEHPHWHDRKYNGLVTHLHSPSSPARHSSPSLCPKRTAIRVLRLIIEWRIEILGFCDGRKLRRWIQNRSGSNHPFRVQRTMERGQIKWCKLACKLSRLSARVLTQLFLRHQAGSSNLHDTPGRPQAR